MSLDLDKWVLAVVLVSEDAIIKDDNFLADFRLRFQAVLSGFAGTMCEFSVTFDSVVELPCSFSTTAADSS